MTVPNLRVLSPRRSGVAKRRKALSRLFFIKPAIAIRIAKFWPIISLKFYKYNMTQGGCRRIVEGQ